MRMARSRSESGNRCTAARRAVCPRVRRRSHWINATFVLLATLTAVLALATPGLTAPAPKSCGSYTFASGQMFVVLASRGVQCAFARKNARAVYLRDRCAKGWKFSRRAANTTGICTRKGRFYLAVLYH